jgi:hypothetical protein
MFSLLFFQPKKLGKFWIFLFSYCKLTTFFLNPKFGKKKVCFPTVKFDYLFCYFVQNINQNFDITKFKKKRKEKKILLQNWWLVFAIFDWFIYLCLKHNN